MDRPRDNLCNQSYTTLAKFVEFNENIESILSPTKNQRSSPVKWACSGHIESVDNVIDS